MDLFLLKQTEIQNSLCYCVSRCVRRAFLCGFDRFSGRSFEHRRAWIQDRLHELAGIFAIDLCAYAVMSNHFHVVLKIDPQQAESWSAEQVMERWCKLYRGPGLAARQTAGDKLSDEDQRVLSGLIETWRERLADISWFMRCINEPIARQANAEDNCKGRFWEGRFKSQALLDVRALLQCMAYVDLNPIRAAIATTPKESEFTSIQARIQDRERSLLPFQDQTKAPVEALPCRYRDYLQLVDWTGRVIRDDKKGAIPADTPLILERLSVNPKVWVRTTKHYGRWYYRIVGTAESLKAAAGVFRQRWFRGAPLDQIVQA